MKEPYDKAYCISLAQTHEREAESCKRDWETAELEDPPKPHLVELFRNRYGEHTRYAKAWKESAESLK